MIGEFAFSVSRKTGWCKVYYTPDVSESICIHGFMCVEKIETRVQCVCPVRALTIYETASISWLRSLLARSLPPPPSSSRPRNQTLPRGFLLSLARVTGATISENSATYYVGRIYV